MEEFDYIFDGLHLRRRQFNGGRFPGRVTYNRRRPDRLIPRTESEKLNHHLMEMMLKKLRPLEQYVEVGFRHEKRKGLLGALTCMIKDALIRDGFEHSLILPTHVSISEGNLAIDIDSFQAYYDPTTSEICVSWDPSAGKGWEGQSDPRDDDRLMVVAQDFWGYGTYGKINGAPRSAGSERIYVDPEIRSYFVYLAFISADGTSQSQSVCLYDEVYTE